MAHPSINDTRRPPPTFMTLPREIRDNIYKQAVPGERKFAWFDGYSGGSNLISAKMLQSRLSSVGIRRTRNGLKGPGLNFLLTNPQIHDEFEAVLLKTNFKFDCSSAALAFCFILRSKCHLIRSIQLTMVLPLHGYRDWLGVDDLRQEEHARLQHLVSRLTGLRSLKLTLTMNLWWNFEEYNTGTWNGTNASMGLKDIFLPVTNLPALENVSVNVEFDGPEYLYSAPGTPYYEKAQELQTHKKDLQTKLMKLFSLATRAANSAQGGNPSNAQFDTATRVCARKVNDEKEESVNNNAQVDAWDIKCLELLKLDYRTKGNQVEIRHYTTNEKRWNGSTDKKKKKKARYDEDVVRAVREPSSETAD